MLKLKSLDGYDGAIFDSDKMVHRYGLWRSWDKEKPFVLFIGLNPSRADHQINDRTITRCVKFADSWGYGGLYFANLYSFRTPYPDILIKHLPESRNADTDRWLTKLITDSAMIVCAWGSWHFISERSKAVLSMVKTPYCLGINKDGQPKHPLYLSKETKPVLYCAL